MKNVIKVALLATTFAASSTAFAGQPVGAAMVSSKVSHQTATATANAAALKLQQTRSSLSSGATHLLALTLPTSALLRLRALRRSLR